MDDRDTSYLDDLLPWVKAIPEICKKPSLLPNWRIDSVGSFLARIRFISRLLIDRKNIVFYNNRKYVL